MKFSVLKLTVSYLSKCGSRPSEITHAKFHSCIFESFPRHPCSLTFQRLPRPDHHTITLIDDGLDGALLGRKALRAAVSMHGAMTLRYE